MSERRQILDEIAGGLSLSQAARKYEVAMQTINRWRRIDAGQEAQPVTSTQNSFTEPVVPLAELKRLQEELKATRKSLAKMTVERDILKDAVEIASKKKWI